MANILINEQYLTDIANAIREQTFSEDTYKPREMAAAIQGISLRQGFTGDDLFAGVPYAVMAETTTVLTDYLSGMKVTKVYAPAAWKIDYNAFNGCNQLTEFRGPQVNTINGGVFYGCNLETVELGPIKNFKPSQWFGFSNQNLKTIILRAESTVFYILSDPDDGWRLPDGCYVYLPRSVYNIAMSETSSWVEAGEQDHLRAIEDYPDICG